MTFRLRHLLAALVLHGVLFGLLLGGIQCSRKPQRPPVIQAVLLDPDRKEVVQQKRRDEQRKLEERRKMEQEKKRQDEARRKVEAEQKRREAEAEAVRRQRELAERKKAEEEARRKQEQEEQREREDQARREIQEKAQMEQAVREEAMRRELDQEQRARAASEREVKLAQWSDAISRHVAKNWTRPAAFTADFECTVRVQQLPDGTVTYARIVKSCGNGQLDKSVEDAVFRSSPLPRPADPSVFDRELIIIFIPEA